MSAPDKKALKILFSTYWSAKGWRRQTTVPPSDFAYAKNAGLMFDPISLTHDKVIEDLIRLRNLLDRKQVVNGFVASLSTRRLDLRSALGSFAVARNFPTHHWKAIGEPINSCTVCGFCKFYEEPQDLSCSNFERFKWGGVWHVQPTYARFDLERFSLESDISPTAEDWKIMRGVVSAIRGMPSTARLSDLVKRLASVFSSNVAERRTLIQILGYCGILADLNHSNFFEGFPRTYERKETPWVKDDWSYPARWWTGLTGISQKALSYWFPFL